MTGEEEQDIRRRSFLTLLSVFLDLKYFVYDDVWGVTVPLLTMTRTVRIKPTKMGKGLPPCGDD